MKSFFSNRTLFSSFFCRCWRWILIHKNYLLWIFWTGIKIHRIDVAFRKSCSWWWNLGMKCTQENSNWPWIIWLLVSLSFYLIFSLSLSLMIFAYFIKLWNSRCAIVHFSNIFESSIQKLLDQILVIFESACVEEAVSR